MASENKINLSLGDNDNKVNYEINSADHKKADAIFKIVDGKKVPLTKEELQKIIYLLNEQAKSIDPEYQYSEEEIQKLSLDSIFEIIKEKIVYKEYSSIEQVKKDLNTYDLNESEKNTLIQRASDYMKELLQKEENEKIADFLKIYSDALHKRRDKNIFLSVHVTIQSDKIGIEMISRDTSKTDNNVQKMTTSFDNDESVRYYLLNTMAMNFALDANVYQNSVTPIHNTLEANLSLSNDNNASLNVDNLSRAYAYEIQKKVSETKPLAVEDIKEQQNVQEEYNRATPDEQFDMDLQQIQGLEGIEKDQLKMENEKAYTRVRKLDNPYNGSSGKINRAFIIACILFAITLITIATLIIFNK